ncbi:restriction endonuclease [Massilia sp. NEAU-DD11]|uniref:Restriction endonuclease n=1 Tax=Massilia cellulosiltytica TaxID=2683234 RepID=A0A7X3G5V1_9BURK|nr:restriction endonuclease [Telluria cellulosilytica]MVW64241.1 restriction endonuclease [Telluria cellulosilytica]
MTIVEAIKTAMRAKGGPMTTEEVYRFIVSERLYEFHADNPAGIVRQQIRRHCDGIEYSSASPTKHFKVVDGGRYDILSSPIKTSRSRASARLQQRRPLSSKQKKPAVATPRKELLSEALSLYSKYLAELKRRILRDLKDLSPSEFERFAKRLLDKYGFLDTHVTQISGDGGIDGHGKLKVGLANLHVAFQCKRYLKGNVQRPEIDKFRGACQGDYEQGLLFTTSSFSEGAIGASIKKGAVPIILIDGPAIVDLMISKGFGVQTEEVLPIYTYALDLALDPS